MSGPESSALAAVARLVADTATLQDLVPRLAAAIREWVPFERLHVLRLDRAESIVLYVVRSDGLMEVTGHRIADSSPAPPEFGAEAASRLVCTVGHGGSVLGALWFTSTQAHAFSAGDQVLVDGVADLLALALQRETLISTERFRRERLETLDRLLVTMAEALDVRQIFAEVSGVVREALPHDVLALTSWAEDRRSIRLYAMTGAEVAEPDIWASTALNADERDLLLNRSPYVVHDVDAELPPDTLRGRMFRRLDARAVLRVPTPLGTGVFGSLLFLAKQPGAFVETDIDFARRVADLLALALSHQRLSEAARRDAAARETAAQLEAQVATLTRELELRTGQRRVVGHSRQWRDVLAHAARVAHTETTVLLTGESGTGKEVVARFIHQGSRRKHGPFVAINCAALPDQLLESELFGHERGAFTGAMAAKPGRIEQAGGGVLFLDEVGEMAPAVQAKMLRVLEEREFQRLGGTRASRADIRLIAATNRDLHAAMRRGEFREDLYYRLGVFEIALPPLRHRSEDILELAEAFLAEIGATVGKPAAGLTAEAKAQLLDYSWPGNVRELRNAIERAVILADGGVIRREHLPVTPQIPTSAQVSSGQAGEPGASTFLPAGGVKLDELERALIVKALAQARHNKTRAAKLLGLTRAQLYSRLDKYGLAESEIG